MLLNWILLFDALTRHPTANRRNAFEDPLERREWQGLVTTNRVLHFLVGRFRQGGGGTGCSVCKGEIASDRGRAGRRRGSRRPRA